MLEKVKESLATANARRGKPATLDAHGGPDRRYERRDLGRRTLLAPRGGLLEEQSNEEWRIMQRGRPHFPAHQTAILPLQGSASAWADVVLFLEVLSRPEQLE